jgi:hypothetical protein
MWDNHIQGAGLGDEGEFVKKQKMAGEIFEGIVTFHQLISCF